MTPRTFARRTARICDGCCPRCGLPVVPWPLRRPDVCHVPGAVTCPRHWPDILAAEARLTVTQERTS